MSMMDGGVKPEQIASELMAESRAASAASKIMQDFLPEGRQVYAGWIERMKGHYAMVTPVLGDVKGPMDSVRSAVEGARADFSQHLSSRLSTIFANYQGRALNAPPQINTAVIASEGDEKEKQSGLERVIQGWINENNFRVQDDARGTSWLWLVTRDGAMSGKHTGRVEAKESFEGSGLLSVVCDIFDPLSCYHDFEGSQRRFIREFRVSRSDAAARLGKMKLPIPTNFDRKNADSVQMAELWFQEPDPKRPGRNRVWSGAMLDSMLVGDMRLTEYNHHWPLVIIATHAGRGLHPSGGQHGQSSSGLISSSGLTSDEMLYHAQPFFWPLYHIYRDFNEFMSLGKMGMLAGLLKARRYRSPNGDWILSPEQDGPGSRTMVKPGQAVEVDNETIVGIAELLREYKAIVDEEISRLYHDIHFGISPAGDSGFKSIIQTSASNAIVNEPLRGVSGFIHRVAVEAFYQWKEFHPDLKIEYKGRTSTGLQAGNMVVQEFSLEDMPEQYAFEINIGPLIPTDNMQAMTYAQAALQSGLIDPEWLREKILNMPDSGAVQARIDDFAMHNSIEAQAERKMRKMWDDVALLEYQAARETNQVKRLQLLMAAIRAKLRAEAYDAQLTGQAQAAGTPQKPVGIRPEVLAPEAGLNNPDLAAAAMGRQSSSTQGRGPSTSREQVA